MKTCPQCRMRYPNEATFCFVEGSDLVALPDPRVGTVLAGRYSIEEVIGEGGMATVYRARNKLTDKWVAVKIMNAAFASDPIVRERFRREARSAQKLAHPNIIEIFDQGDTEDGTTYIVMEVLDGESLGTVTQRGALEIDRAVQMMVQMARGLARAHDLEVIHRDIKPENIFVSRREDGSSVVKILDFGIAKSRQDSRLTGQGELFGTPQYMAPERIMSQDSGGSSDIYALGVVFFEMLTGELPFNAPDVATFFVKHMNEPPPPLRSLNPRVPEKLDDLVMRMLAKEPKDRPVDCHRVHQDLLELIADRAIDAPPMGDDPPPTQSPAALVRPAEQWTRRIHVLDQMLARAFGDRARAPEALARLLDDARRIVDHVQELRREGMAAAKKIDEIDARGREMRAQLGFAVDQLGVDASKAKEEVRAGKEALRIAEDEVGQAQRRFEAAHKEAMFWEGRSGFAEPTTDLAQAYHALGDAVDVWAALRSAERKQRDANEAAERNVSDLDFQIRELRSRLTSHEQEIDDARAACEKQIVARGTEADRLETDLLELMTRFCQPLRSRPELEVLFRELETEAA